MNDKNKTPCNIVLFLRPRTLRPPLAGAYIGGTAGLVEQLWRDGLLCEAMNSYYEIYDRQKEAKSGVRQ
jgi:hypothetical protein